MTGTRVLAGRSRRAVVACVCAVVLSAVAACSSTNSSTGAQTGSPASATGSSSGTSSEPVITIDNFAFTTPPSVSPGAKVTVHNMDSVAHTVTADSGGSFDDSAQPGNSSFTAPAQPGSYPFHCNIHPEMHGVLVVQ